jgi:hypothetical protein
MVDPKLAGVSFTGLDGTSDDITVEYVEGLAEGLVAGTADPYRTTSDDTGNLPAEHREIISEVLALTAKLREDRGHDVDVEWAADDSGVRLLQVRPVTARRSERAATAGDCLWTARMYFDELPAGASLHEVEAVFAGYSAKRGPAHRMAHSHDVSVGAGWVVGFTARALLSPEYADRLRGTLAEGRSGSCVLDFGENLRQIIVPKDQVVGRLLEVLGGPAATGEHAVVVRDFIRGDLGVISRSTGDGLVVEYTPEGLLALNRGTAGAEAIVVTADGKVNAPESAGPVLRHKDTIARFTAAMQEKYGDVTLEWVLDGDTLLFVDYSVLGADDVLIGASGIRISTGSAHGPLITLDDDDLLGRLSVGPAVSIDKSRDVTEYAELATIIEKIASLPEPPVVRASRPYAVLSVLMDKVAGFVFEQGSALCHLAILLREARVPAVVTTELTGFPDGAHAVIADGSVTVASAQRSTHV